MRILLIVLGGLVSIVLSFGRAEAGVEWIKIICNEVGTAEVFLGGKYGEVPVEGGTDPAGNLVTVWVNRETRTWSFVLLTPEGKECLIEKGENWIVFEKVIEGTES